MSELTITISPKDESDFNFVGFVTELYESDIAFLVAKHTESGHANYHVFTRHSKKVRTDNLRRKFIKYISGDSILRYALDISQAYSLQSFINYVYHEESVQLLLRHKIEDQELQTCLENKKSIKKCSGKTFVLTIKNSVNLITEFCKKNELLPVTHAESEHLAAELVRAGYTIAPVRRQLSKIMSEVLFRLTDDKKYLAGIVSEMCDRETALNSYYMMP